MSPIGVYADQQDTQDLNDRIDQAAQAQQQYQSFAHNVNQALVDQGAQWAQFQAMAQQHATATDGAYNDFLSAVQDHLAQQPGPTPTPSPTPTPAPGPTNQKQGPRTGMQDATPAPSGDVVDAIVGKAQQYGVDPALALATAMQESGLNPQAVGDQGTSFGLYQLHQGGELGSLTPEQAQDPSTNADVALSTMAQFAKDNPSLSGGALAAASQRPADQAGYAASVNALLPKAQALLAQRSGGGGQQGPGSFAEQDVSGLLANMGYQPDPSLPNPSHVGEAPPDNGPSPSDQQTPVSTYVQQQPDGTWAQVQRMASGDYRATPIAPPSPEAQAVYQAQNAATSGFASPTENVPLLAGSAPGAQVAQPEMTPEAQAASIGYQAQQAAPLGPYETPAAPSAPATPNQSQPAVVQANRGTDIKSMLADALHQVADKIAGAVSQPTASSDIAMQGGALGLGPHATQGPALAPGATQGDLIGDVEQSGAAQFLNGNSGSFGVLGEPLTDEQVQQAADAARAQGDIKTADMLLGTQQANKALQATAQAASVVAPEVAAAADLVKAGAGAKAAEAVPEMATAAKAAPEVVDAAYGQIRAEYAHEPFYLPTLRSASPDVLRGIVDRLSSAESFTPEADIRDNAQALLTHGPGAGSDAAPEEMAAATPEAKAGDVGDVASQVVDHAAPVMAGAAQGPAPKAIADLNDLIGSFGQAIDKSATPAEAVRQVSQADTAATALAKGLSDEYAKFKLTPEESQGVADVIEGVSRVGKPPLRAEVAQVADALKATNDATWRMAHDAGVLDGMTEGYFTHLVRVPANELQQMGGSITPGALSDWSRFAAGRARDEAGNVLNPTVQDLKDYLAQAHPTWQVVDDVPTVVAAHVRSLVTAADHAALADYLKAAVDADGQPLLSAVKRAGDVQLNVPSSLSKWLYRGEAPEEGTITVANRGGVLGEGGSGQGVVTQQPLMWARPEAAEFLDRFIAPDMLADMLARNRVARNFATKVGPIYDTLNHGLVATRMMNPVIHPINMLSKLAGQYARPSQLSGILGDIQNAEQVLRDSVTMTKLLQEAPLNLSSVRQFAARLARATGKVPEDFDVPILSSGKNMVGKAFEANHNFVFNTIGQRLQLMSYFGARRAGMDAVEAAKYANAKFGQFSKQDFERWTQWIGQHMLFAGQWTNGSMVQYGSLLRNAGWGGYTVGLTPTQSAFLARALRGDLIRETGMLGGVGALVFYGVTNKTPWQDPAGYLAFLGHSPLFRVPQDLFKLVTNPKGTVANKLAPVASTAGYVGENLHTYGFIKGLERSLQSLPYFAGVPGAQLPSSKPQPQADNGLFGALVGERTIQANSSGAGVMRPTRPHGPSRPH